MSRRITQRRRRAKRARQRERAKPALVKASQRRARLQIVAGPLEIARGHDGLLRGYPEPVVVIAAYAVAADRSQLLTREVVRYEPVSELPSVVPAREPRAAGSVHLTFGAAIAVLAIAVEEDSSRDIQRLVAELAECDAIIAWPAEALPGTLEQLRDALPPEAVAELQLQLAGQFPAVWFSRDDYVSAAGAWLEVGGRRSVELTFPLRSADGRNDWRARVTIRFR